MKSIAIISIFLLLGSYGFGQGRRTYTDEELREADWYLNEQNDTIIYSLLVDEIQFRGRDTIIILEEIFMTNDSIRLPWWRNEWLIEDGLERKHGIQKHYNENDYLDVEYYYSNGVKNEEWKAFLYYDNGSIFRIDENQKEKAKHSVYYPTGELWLVYESKNGKMWNISEYLNREGEIMKIGSLKDGTGSFYCYDKENNKIGKIVFKKGKRIKGKSTCSCRCY